MALIIYSSRTGRIRRIVTDRNRDDRALDFYMPKSAGESSRGMALFGSLLDQQIALNVLTGLRPANDRYVAYDSVGVVDRCFIGDPDAGDLLRNRTIIADANAQIGWRRNTAGTAWERSTREIDADIQFENDTKTRVNSQEWQDQQAAREQTQAQIDAKRTVIIVDAANRIAVLNTENTDRTGTRP